MLAVSNLRAQTSRTCGILPMDSATFVNKPWHGNNQFLLDLNDSIGYPAANPKNGSNDGFDTQTVYWIPIKAWVYNDDNGNGALNSDTVRDHAAWLRQYGTMVTSKVTPTSPLGNTADWYHYYSVHKLMLPSPIQLVGLTYFSYPPPPL